MVVTWIWKTDGWTWKTDGWIEKNKVAQGKLKN